LAKVEIVTEAIGCQNPQHLVEQENELMAYRKAVCSTIEEWFGKYSKIPIYIKPITNITNNWYAKEHKCHRQFDGDTPGIVCYCDHSVIKNKNRST